MFLIFKITKIIKVQNFGGAVRRQVFRPHLGPGMVDFPALYILYIVYQKSWNSGVAFSHNISLKSDLSCKNGIYKYWDPINHSFLHYKVNRRWKFIKCYKPSAGKLLHLINLFQGGWQTLRVADWP